MRRNALIITAIIAFALGAAARVIFTGDRAVPPAALREDSIRAAALNRFEALGSVPGAVVGVRIGDEFKLLFAIGLADPETGESMRIGHPFRVASVAKPFLGTVALRLADEGLLDLDAPISEHLPDIPHADVVTPRMLAANTAGYFNAVADPGFRKEIVADPSKLWSAEEILAVALEKPLALERPGEGWSYSNTNSVLLAELVRVATGAHWSVALDRLVIEPLGLESVVIEEPGSRLPAPADDVASPPLPRGFRHATTDSAMEYGNVLIDASAFSPSWAGAAGSMRANAHDLLRAVEPILTGALLSTEARADLLAWIDTGHESAASAFSDVQPIYYAFCVGKRRINGVDFVGHTGDVPGFSSFFGHNPASRTSVVVLCNLSNTPRRLNPAEEMAEAIIAALVGE